jgi:hypothetical protein
MTNDNTASNGNQQEDDDTGQSSLSTCGSMFSFLLLLIGIEYLQTE